jgi:predicted enzyme related to lactoylglutathione lyase
MHRPVHFEIHAPDPDTVIPFYEKNFGWKFTKWSGPMEYWVVDTGEGTGINGGLMRSRDGQPRTVNTLEVADVDEALKKAAASGGQVVVPKFPVQGVGFIAYCTDPGGNIFGVAQFDTQAK